MQTRGPGRIGAFREGRDQVAPAELATAPTARCVIRMDAAFGSGDHPSSYLCLRALEWLAKFRRFRRILDVGGASGLLSIAALKTSPAQASALDINPFVTAKAHHNIRANHIASRVRISCDLGASSHRLPRGTRFQLALVNLNVAGAYRAHGFTLRKIFRQDGWSELVMEARPHRTLARSPNLRCIPLAPSRPAPSLRATI